MDNQSQNQNELIKVSNMLNRFSFFAAIVAVAFIISGGIWLTNFRPNESGGGETAQAAATAVFITAPLLLLMIIICLSLAAKKKSLMNRTVRPVANQPSVFGIVFAVLIAIIIIALLIFILPPLFR